MAAAAAAVVSPAPAGAARAAPVRALQVAVLAVHRRAGAVVVARTTQAIQAVGVAAAPTMLPATAAGGAGAPMTHPATTGDVGVAPTTLPAMTAGVAGAPTTRPATTAGGAGAPMIGRRYPRRRRALAASPVPDPATRHGPDNRDLPSRLQGCAPTRARSLGIELLFPQQPFAE